MSSRNLAKIDLIEHPDDRKGFRKFTIRVHDTRWNIIWSSNNTTLILPQVSTPYWKHSSIVELTGHQEALVVRDLIFTVARTYSSGYSKGQSDKIREIKSCLGM